MDGNSKSHFRNHRHDFPQNTELFSWYLSHYHWHNGYYRLHQQVRITPEVKVVVLVSVDYGLSDGCWLGCRRNCLVEGTD